ncbi:hypothetical protein F5Y18DRAFT_428046 [Xylariaceae sp. FL1019]|nr:hypothetical protein F5Y18DRAFT_428046 [Xylariaceae sp. FL1019]
MDSHQQATHMIDPLFRYLQDTSPINRHLGPDATGSRSDMHQSQDATPGPRPGASDTRSINTAGGRFEGQQRRDRPSLLVPYPLTSTTRDSANQSSDSGARQPLRGHPSLLTQREEEEDPKPIYVAGPSSAYALYRASRYPALKAAGVSLAQRSSITAKEWRENLTPEQRAPFERQRDQQEAECRLRGWDGKKTSEASHKRDLKAWEERQRAKKSQALKDQQNRERAQRQERSMGGASGQSLTRQSRDIRYHPYDPIGHDEPVQKHSGIHSLAQRGEMSKKDGRVDAADQSNVTETPSAFGLDISTRNKPTYGTTAKDTDMPLAHESLDNRSTRHHGYGDELPKIPRRRQTLNNRLCTDPEENAWIQDFMRQGWPIRGNGIPTMPATPVPSTASLASTPAIVPFSHSGVSDTQASSLTQGSSAATNQDAALHSRLQEEVAEAMEGVADVDLDLSSQPNQNVGNGEHHQEMATSHSEESASASEQDVRDDAASAEFMAEVTRRASQWPDHESSQKEDAPEETPLFFGETAEHEEAWERHLTYQWEAHQ